MQPQRPNILLCNRALIFNNQNKILLVKRSNTDTFMPGKWELPGGKLDMGQDIKSALEREVLEETGLSIQAVNKLAYWESKIIETGKYKDFTYVEITGTATTNNDSVTLSHEHDDYEWVIKDKVFDYDLVIETRNALQELLKNP